MASHAWEQVVEPCVWQTVQELFGAPGRRSGRSEVADDYTYCLRGCVLCPHCGCPYTQASHHGKTTRVHYYVCQKANRREKCPVGRVNADRLHHTVLNYMHYASQHPTVMHRLIAQPGGWGTADEAQKVLRGQLGKQKQALEMRIANYVKAVGDGRMSDALLNALSKAEADKEEISQQLMQADRDLRAATIKRPTAAQVQEAWGSIQRVWKVLTEEERADLLGSFVQSVEITEKENVTLELLPKSHSLDSYSNGFALKSEMGAGTGITYTIVNPRIKRVSLFVPSGGSNRTKVPRPERRTRTL